MHQHIVPLLRKMQVGEELTRNELLRLIVHDLVEPKCPVSDPLMPSSKAKAQSDFVITTKGSEYLKNAIPFINDF